VGIGWAHRVRGDWARVSRWGGPFYTDAVKKNERPRIVVKRDLTVGKF
jgi:hypothetical protein